MSEILYRKLLKEIEGCTDCTITNLHDVIIGRGIGMSNNMAFVHMLDKDCIELQEFNSTEPLAIITPDGKVLKAFKDILEDLEHVELIEFTDDEINLLLEDLWINYIYELENGTKEEAEQALELFVSTKRDGILPNKYVLTDHYQEISIYEDEELRNIINKIIKYAD